MSDVRLSPQQVARFDEDGYVIVRKLFTAQEMDLLIRIAKADREMDKASGRKDAQGGVSRLRLRNEFHDDIYSACVRCRRMVDPMEQLLRGEVYHFHHKMMLKEPRVGGAWEWHQDYGYWYKHNSCLFPFMASAMIAVDQATKENGCLQVITGSHHCGRIEHGVTGEQTGADMERVTALLERLPLVYVELEPGDVCFFHSNLLHRSDQNRSERPRWSLIGCYNAARNSPYKHREGSHPQYHYLEKWDDQKVLEVGSRQWAQMQGELAAAR